MWALLSKNLPWGKIAIGLTVLFLTAALAWQTNQLHHTRQQLTNERSQRGEVAKIIGAEDNWISIRTHARDMKTSNVNLNKALQDISKQTLADKARADAADAALAREQSENAKRFAQAQKTIDALMGQKSTGSDPLDDQIIDEISKLPWAGWHNPQGKTREAMNYDVFQPTKTQLTVTVRLVPYEYGADLRNAYIAMSGKSAKQMDGWVIAGFQQDVHGVCEVHMMDPKKLWNADARDTLGHEMAHCFYGAWHKDPIQ